MPDGARPPETQEEWPPRQWRETSRAAGQRQALYVALGMVAIFVLIAVLATWASRNG